LAGICQLERRSVTLQPIAVTVLAPVQAVLVGRDAGMLASPGDSSDGRHGSAQRRPVARSGTLSVGVPSGWSAAR